MSSTSLVIESAIDPVIDLYHFYQSYVTSYVRVSLCVCKHIVSTSRVPILI